MPNDLIKVALPCTSATHPLAALKRTGAINAREGEAGENLARCN
jgi:hypothetical protein